MSSNTAQIPNEANYVRLLSGVTVAASVTFDDAEIVEILGQVPESRRVEFFIRGTRSGLIAMGNDVTGRLREAVKFMQASLDTQVNAFGERMVGKVNEQLGDAEKRGHVEQRLGQILDGLQANLNNQLEKAIPEAFEKQTRKSGEVIDAEGKRVIREIAGLFAENGIAWNVIQETRRDFAQRLEEVKLAVTVAQTKAANPTPREAGLDYEAWVHGQLATIGGLRGDDVELTAGKAGKVSRCLKGDSRILVATEGIDVTAPPCVAVEIRDREDSEFALSDVAVMLENREAQFALIVAAHPGSLPKQYADRPFVLSRPKRLVTLVLDPDVTGSETVLAATYQLVSALALESVRRSRDGDWDAAAHKVDEIEAALEAITEARTALGQIEKKAHDAGTAADKRHALLVRLVAELRALM